MTLHRCPSCGLSLAECASPVDHVHQAAALPEAKHRAYQEESRRLSLLEALARERHPAGKQLEFERLPSLWRERAPLNL